MSEELKLEIQRELDSILNRMTERIMDDLMFSVDFAIREVALEAMKHDSGDGAAWLDLWSQAAKRSHSAILERLGRRKHE